LIVCIRNGDRLEIFCLIHLRTSFDAFMVRISAAHHRAERQDECGDVQKPEDQRVEADLESMDRANERNY